MAAPRNAQDDIDKTPSNARWLADGVSTPALVIDRDTFEENLNELAAVASREGVELFPHAKTHRMAEAGLQQIARGADGLCVAKLGEAEFFADASVERIFVAYPVVGMGKAERALALHNRLHELTIGTDSVEAARKLAHVFENAGAVLRVMLAIDTGLGREGVLPKDAPALATALEGIPGIQLVGIYTHEGTVYTAANRQELAEASVSAARLMVGVAAAIRASGLDVPHVSMGASASARLVAEVDGVTQIRPGIYAFNDVGQIALGNATLDSTAIRVVATVVSHTSPGHACIDAGSKSLSTDLVPASAHREEYPGHGIIVNAPGWIVDKLSEEHGVLRWVGPGEPSKLEIGMQLEIVPNHACMAFAMLRRAQVVSGGKLIGIWDSFSPGSSE